MQYHFFFPDHITLFVPSRFGYDYFGGYERGVGGRPGYPDEKSYGRVAHRSAGGYQNGISGMLKVVNDQGFFFSLYHIISFYL